MKDALLLLQDPSYHLVLLVLASSTAAVCMVAIWTGKSRWHWFVGALAI